MLINFNTGYYDKGILITDRRMIINKYFKETLFLDLCSTIPIIYVFKRNIEQPIDYVISSFIFLKFFAAKRCWQKI
jgi:hypothetical protein